MKRPYAARWRLGLALAPVLLVAACGGSSSGPASQPGYDPTHADFAQVRSLLASRAAAVLHHDEAGFLATVDDRDPALVREQRTLFENMSQLRVASLAYAMDPSVELEPGPVRGAGPVFRPQVYEFLQIAGTMQHPVSNALQLTFVRDGRRWLVGAETAASDNDAFDAAQERPWFGKPIAATRLDDLTVLDDRGQRDALRPLAAAIHADIVFDAHQLGIQPSYQLLVDATSNGNATTFSNLSTEQAGAVEFALDEVHRHDPESFQALAGHAIKLNPQHAGAYAADTGLLRHELTHFLLHEYTGDNPKWLVEGIANWMEYYPDAYSERSVVPAFYHRLMSADRELPSIGLFNVDPDVNYEIAQAAVAWLVGHYGMPKLLALMKAYQTHYQGVDVDALTPQMLRLVYGVTERQVVAGAFGLLATYQH